MARITFVLDLPDISVAELQQTVHEWDEDLSGPNNGIAPEDVTASDVIGLWCVGELGTAAEVILVNQMEDLKEQK